MAVDALWRLGIAVQRKAERVVLRVLIQPCDLELVAHQCPLDLLAAVVLIRRQIQRDDPVASRDHPDPTRRVLAVAASWDLVEAPDT